MTVGTRVGAVGAADPTGLLAPQAVAAAGSDITSRGAAPFSKASSAGHRGRSPARQAVLDLERNRWVEDANLPGCVPITAPDVRPRGTTEVTSVQQD